LNYKNNNNNNNTNNNKQESRLFHEVGNVIGTRFNITAMFKKVVNINDKPILEGEEWLSKDNFGIDLNSLADI